MYKFISFSLLTFFFCICISIFEVNAATINAASCSKVDVEAAISSASNGDIVVIPTCTGASAATWSSFVIISKEITVQGQTVCTRDDTTFEVSCVDGTVINTSGFRLLSNNIRITGITLQASSGIAFSLANTITGFRLDHNKVDGWSGFINKGGRGLKSGVIDHNLIPDCRGECIYLVGEGNASWDKGGGLGNDYPEGTVFIEDNYFTLPTDTGNNIFDAGGGARLVFRYNKAEDNVGHSWGYWLDTHGHCYGFRDENHNAGTYGLEIYGNIFKGTDPGFSAMLKLRGGRGYFYENTLLGSGLKGSTIGMFNDETSFSVCNDLPCPNQAHEDWGLHPVPLEVSWQCNAGGSPPSDYPCPLQINNFYVFDNTQESGTFGLWVTANFVDYAIEDRDFYDDIGVGDTNFMSDVAANRPVTCTVNDSYWETDNKILYNCKTTNVWTKVYEPYEYPHPLTKPYPPET